MSDAVTQVSVITGADFSLSLKLRDENDDPAVLTSVTEIRARFPKADGSVLEKTKTASAVVVTSDVLGLITVNLSDADTTLLKQGIISFEIWLETFNGAEPPVLINRDIAQFKKSIQVVPNLV